MAITIEGKVWAEEELEFIDRRLDTITDTTTEGRRCDWRYRGMDYFGDVEQMRCPNTATVNIHVVENRPPYESYDAVLCGTCAARCQEPPSELAMELFGDNGEHTITIIGTI